MKKNLFILLFLLNSICSFSQMVVGYLPYYRGFNESYDYSKYTHIHYFTIWPGAKGEFIYPGNMDSTSMAKQFKLVANRARQNNVKMIITFGGPSDHGSLHFVEMASNDSTRSVFIQNVLGLCKSWNADGIDIDWEWAQHSNTETSNYAFTNLMQDLRKMTTENGLSLSLDVAASSWNGKYYNPEAVNLADYINVMTYAYNGSWSDGAAHHSSIKKIAEVGMPFWLNKGIPASKLNIGTAFFAQVYQGTYLPGGSFTKVSSVLYPEVIAFISSGYKIVEDNLNGSYCFSENENQIVFYDSPLNVNKKMEYVKENGYSGLIIWEIGQDDNSQTLSTAIDNARNQTNTTISTKIENPFPFILRQKNKRLIVDNTQKEYTLIIYSTKGEQLIHQKNSHKNYVDVSRLPAGFYIISLNYSKNNYRQKIVIH